MTRVPSDSSVASVLAENHGRFLTFLERRVRSREIAEDVLQEAVVRGLVKAPPLATDESVVAWFYQVLRNALVDHHRRTGARRRALERLAHEPAVDEVPALDADLLDTVCTCVRSLVTTLRADYADAITRMDLDGVAVPAYARERGITPNNAAVRRHRAHKALLRRVRETCETCATHACRGCTCGSGAGPAARPPSSGAPRLEV